jgi:glycosyltransferase involved in cell wall biosynthesis
MVTCHNIASRRPSFFLRYLKVGKAVYTFQCLSSAQAGRLADYPGIRPDQIRLLYWHVDHHFFAPLPEVPAKNQICSAGMASRDYATLVMAAQELDLDVKIAADSPWFPQKLNIAAEKVPPRMEVRSYKNYQALRQLYAESLFVVVPLVDVPYSAGYTVILEAMAMGKAVIVSRIKQRDDFIIDGWNGLYVTPGNVAELRERICFLLERPEEASRLGANARKTVEERFTLNHYIQRMEEDINNVNRREEGEQS